MGRSLRRIKKHKPRIIKSAAKRRNKGLKKSKLPDEITAQRPDFQKKLGSKPDWDAKDTVIHNYEASQLVRDPNAGFGRNKRADLIQKKVPEVEELEEEELEAQLDDDLKAACGKERSTGKAPPKRLTTHQRQIVQRLVAAHGDDLKAMKMDRKLNPMQHSEGVLKQLIEAFNYWKPGSGVDFRVPVKSNKIL